MKRQVFFVGIGGFDTRSKLLSLHPSLLAEINTAISLFYAATEELQVENQVTTFSASDIDRTLN